MACGFFNREEKMMKKFLAFALTAILLLSAALPAFAIGNISTSFLTIGTVENSDELPLREYDPNGTIYPFTGTKKGVRNQTVMLYLCGSNLEGGGNGGNGGGATRDLKEIVASEYDQDQISVIIMAGGAQKWFNNAVDVQDTAIYEVVDNSLVKRMSNGILNMGSADTLSLFVNFCYEKYPAKNYSLIVWDHGGGPVGGLVDDALSNGHMSSVLTVEEALKKTPAALEKLAWFGFDACLEGSAEIAKVMAPYAKYLIASEESEPNGGWNYIFLKGLEKDQDGAKSGNRIVSTYLEQFRKDYPAKVTLACIDLEKISDLVKKCDAFFTALDSKLNGESYVSYAEVRQKLETFSDEKMDLIDLEQMTQLYEKIAPQEAKELLDTIRQIVTDEVHNKGVSSGLSVYFPYYNPKGYKRLSELHKKLDYSDAYTRFIDHFNELQTSGGYDWTNLTNKEATRDTRTVFTLRLTPEQAAVLAESKLVVVRRCEDGNGGFYYVIVNPDGVTELEENQLSGDYVHSALYAVSAGGEILNPLPLCWQRDAEGHYLLNAALVSGDVTVDVQLVCDLNAETQQLEIVNILVWDENEQYYSSRYDIDPDAYESIVFTVPGYTETRDENGVLTGIFDWNVATEVSYALDNHGDWTLQMVLDSIDQSELFAAFVLTDYQRLTHTNELVPVVPAASAYPVFVLTYDDDHVVIANRVSLNNGDVYILFTASNPNAEEVFVHIDNVTVNGIPVETDTWIEGNGDFDGIPSTLAGSDTLVIPGLAIDDLNALQTITLNFTIVNAETDEVIAVVPASGYMNAVAE